MSDDMRVPDYAAPIRAHRVWRIDFTIDETKLIRNSLVRLILPDLDTGDWGLDIVKPEPVLRAWNHGAPWSVGWNRATCVLGKPHDAPDFDCKCGFYAVPKLTQMWPGECIVEAHRDFTSDLTIIRVAVPGVVELRGRIIEHEKGYRAEYARPIAILNAAYHSPWLTSTSGIFDLIASIYGMHLVTFPDILEAMTSGPVADMYDQPPAPNPQARLLLGGPVHGMMVTMQEELIEYRVPIAGVRMDDARCAVYHRVGGASYQYDREERYP